MENYTRGKLLGKGSFGSAFLAESKVDGKSYVIKEVDISRMPASEKIAAEQEAKVTSSTHWRMLMHPASSTSTCMFADICILWAAYAKHQLVLLAVTDSGSTEVAVGAFMAVMQHHALIIIVACLPLFCS